METNSKDWIKIAGFIVTIMLIFCSVVLAYSAIANATEINAAAIIRLQQSIDNNSTAIDVNSKVNSEQGTTMMLILQRLTQIDEKLATISKDINK